MNESQPETTFYVCLTVCDGAPKYKSVIEEKCLSWNDGGDCGEGHDDSHGYVGAGYVGGGACMGGRLLIN